MSDFIPSKEELIANRGVYLADGTFVDADAGYSNGDLWVWIKDESMSLLQAVTLFGDATKTASITYEVTSRERQTWEGFTKMITANVDYDGKISIRLVRG